MSDRYVSPLGDSRSHSVPCLRCRRPTFALDATCDFCLEHAPDPHDRVDDEYLSERYDHA